MLTMWKPGDSYCGTAMEAINFALDGLMDVSAIEFLEDWRTGNLAEWPEFQFEAQERGDVCPVCGALPCDQTNHPRSFNSPPLEPKLR